jgi:hypothetical protein
MLYRVKEGDAQHIDELRRTESQKELEVLEEDIAATNKAKLDQVEEISIAEEGENEEELSDEGGDVSPGALRRTKGVQPLPCDGEELSSADDIFKGHLPPKMLSKKPSFARKNKTQRKSVLFRVRQGDAQNISEKRPNLGSLSEETEANPQPARRLSAPGGTISRVRTDTLRQREYYYDRW